MVVGWLVGWCPCHASTHNSCNTNSDLKRLYKRCFSFFDFKGKPVLHDPLEEDYRRFICGGKYVLPNWFAPEKVIVFP